MKFGISVPVGAWHDFLPSALESLLRQRAEVDIAFLDASGDPRVKALADRYGDRLAYRRHGPDGGQSDAILEGWARLDSDWLGWLNADDILMPEALEIVARRQESDPALEVIYGHSTILNDAGDMTGYHFNVQPPGKLLLQSDIISQPSCFFSRSVYQRAGGLNPSLHYVMDWDLWIRMYRAGGVFGFVDTPLSMVLWGRGTKTASLNRRRWQELRQLLAEHAPGEVRQARFVDFAVHTLTDMAWPPQLKERLVRRFRGVGQTLFGLRADGRMAQESRLFLAHYSDEPKRGLILLFDREPGHLAITSGGQSLVATPENKRVRVDFASPVPKGTAIILDIHRQDGPGEVYFRQAAWEPR